MLVSIYLYWCTSLYPDVSLWNKGNKDFVFVFVFIKHKGWVLGFIQRGLQSRGINSSDTGPERAKIFSASLLVSKQNQLPFNSWHNHDFHMNTSNVHTTDTRCKTRAQNKWKMPEKNSLKNIFLFPCIIFKVNFQLWGSEMPSCNITPYQWCVYWAWVKTSYIMQLYWLYLNYNVVA